MAASQSTPPGTQTGDMDILSINTIRTLSMDAVQKANSGHPGTAMAMAPVMYTLWQDFLRYDPAAPIWPNRDRFVLSIGHASMLLYSMLHLAGVQDITDDRSNPGQLALSLEDLEHFRQIGSRTPGHPEYRHTAGVETTTGPLGQGVANSVGMAVASKWLGEHYNRPGFPLYDFNVYSIMGDGDTMEGISSEAASIAGHLKLGNLCWFYDSNRITIEGKTDLALSEDVAARYRAYGWNVSTVTDANDRVALAAEIAKFVARAGADNTAPTLIIVDSHIGFGAPTKQDTKEAHGEPLGDEEIKGAKRFYGWPEDAKFLVPDGVYQHFQQGIGKRGEAQSAAWKALFAGYKQQYPELAAEIEQMEARTLQSGWDKDIPTFATDPKGMAGREASGKVINAVGKNVPWLIGGSADLNPSTKTRLTFDGAGDFEAATHGGRNFHFGIREHVMASMLNGMSLCKVRPYGSGFLIFSDYARPAIRLSAIMEIPTIHVFTHDSIGVGEDGPTHQPIEQLASLRAIPGMTVIRPADANEVAEAWRVVMPMTHHPVLLALTRQALPTFDRTKYASAAGVAKGAYILADASTGTQGQPDVILMASGSEVTLCLDAYEKLAAEGIKVRVVSMPSWELFERQSQEYRDSVLPPSVTRRVAVEMASTFGWERYALTGPMIGMRSFGASAPLKDLLKKFGFTVDAVVAAAHSTLT